MKSTEKIIQGAVKKLAAKRGAFSTIEVKGGTGRIVNTVHERIELTFYAPGVPDGRYRADVFGALGRWESLKEPEAPLPPPLHLGAPVAVVPMAIWQETARNWDKLAPFVSDDESRYFMNGINFSSAGVQATDSRVLAYIDYEAVKEGSFSVRPSGTGLEEVAESLAFYADPEGRQPYALYKAPLFYLIAQTTEGQFPNCARVIADFTEEIRTAPGAIRFAIPSHKELQEAAIIKPKIKKKITPPIFGTSNIEGAADRAIRGAECFTLVRGAMPDPFALCFQYKYLAAFVKAGFASLEGWNPRRAWKGEAGGVKLLAMPFEIK